MKQHGNLFVVLLCLTGVLLFPEPLDNCSGGEILSSLVIQLVEAEYKKVPLSHGTKKEGPYYC